MGIVDKLRQEFDLSVECLGFEIHPNTLQEGMLLSTMFPQLDAQNMFRHLRDMAAPHGILFADIARISNSRMSLEVSEFAKEHGRFDQFHRALFRTSFSKGIEIGNLEVLACTGHDAGLDRDALVQALQSGKVLPMIENMRKEAARLDVTAAPTFIIEGKVRICGAQPIEVFRKKPRKYQLRGGDHRATSEGSAFSGLLKTPSYHTESSKGSAAGSGRA
jgi:predicted DsbA family dithiol-disulfide isomerase